MRSQAKLKHTPSLFARLRESCEPFRYLATASRELSARSLKKQKQRSWSNAVSELQFIWDQCWSTRSMDVRLAPVTRPLSQTLDRVHTGPPLSTRSFVGRLALSTPTVRLALGPLGFSWDRTDTSLLPLREVGKFRTFSVSRQSISGATYTKLVAFAVDDPQAQVS